jgi:hypothetical protein
MQRTTRPPNLEAFKAGELKSVLLGQPGDLEGACFLLNSQKPLELCAEFRRLVAAWQESGPNLANMLEKDKVLADRVRHGRTLLVPTRSGRGYLLWLPNPPGFNAREWKDHALTHFMDLIVNPQWHKLGGPCHRCGKYYIKKTARQKAYCSRRCGSVATALATTRRKRREERAHKLRKAEEAIGRLATVRIRLPWKKWVSAETKITEKWLTRAVNLGDLGEPAKR